jgi:outer membrane biosynthesis protein TonB
MKKYQTGGGIREGKARFSDDVRERARKAIEDNLRMAERTEREPPVKPKPKPVASAKKVTPPKDTKPTPIPKVSRVDERTDREPPVKPKSEKKPEKKSGQFGPATTFPKNVGAGKAAEARKESMSKQSPFGDLMDLIRGKKSGGVIKKAAGGSVSKRADGCAIRGKTKGRFV